MQAREKSVDPYTQSGQYGRYPGSPRFPTQSALACRFAVRVVKRTIAWPNSNRCLACRREVRDGGGLVHELIERDVNQDVDAGPGHR
jgi:hypothetical protein